MSKASKSYAEIKTELDAACDERIALCLPFLQQYSTEIANAIKTPDSGHLRIEIRGPRPDYLADKSAFICSLRFAVPVLREILVRENVRGSVQDGTLVQLVFCSGPLPAVQPRMPDWRE